MSEPPNKKIKAGQDFVDLINECYTLYFRNSNRSEEDQEKLRNGMQQIREILEQISSSSDVSLGSTRTAAKISWGKCLGLLVEDGANSFKAMKILTEKLNPGGGLLLTL